MTMVQLNSEVASVVVDAERGGRIASLEVAGHELLVPAGDRQPLRWGCYPMVPWAGRVRHGRFEHRGAIHLLPRNLPPHSAHGVGFTAPWTLIDETEIELELGPPWPFAGRVTQRFDLDGTGLTVTMTVTAAESMPLVMGWHPWFRRRLDGPGGPVEAELAFGPAMMYELDDEAIPTGELVSPPPGPWDNCFVSLHRQPTISWPGVVDLELTSSCDHWVVFTEPEHALCVEPQTDAPDAFNRSPEVVEAGGQRRAWVRFGWP